MKRTARRRRLSVVVRGRWAARVAFAAVGAGPGQNVGQPPPRADADRRLSMALPNALSRIRSRPACAANVL